MGVYWREFLVYHSSELAVFWDTCLKFLLAVVLAGLVGLERERRGRAAGLRTHVLVCLGATLSMVVSNLLAEEFRQTGITVWLDRGRIAAGILTGIGFVGAGAVINVGSTHRGLTTAAMIWFVAALGIAIGAGYYFVATAATLFAFVTVTWLHRLSDLLPYHDRFVLSLRMPGGAETIDRIEDAIRDHGFIVVASRLRVAGDGSRMDMTFEVNARAKQKVEHLIAELQAQFKLAERITVER